MTRVVATILGLVLMPAAAFGGEDTADTRDWQGAAQQALEQLDRALDSLKGVVERMPHYGMPYIDEDGDIVIPRQAIPRHRGAPPPVPGEPEILEI